MSTDAFGFPPTHSALSDPPGLLAVGGDLSEARLLHAYSKGIFPWYSADEPILWWTPSPRCVLFPADLKVSRSLRKCLKRPFQARLNTAFDQVIELCATVDNRQSATWISGDMQTAYKALHTAGFAHSIEVYEDNMLIGGLYGLRLGSVFFGESMFSLKPNASKIALVALCHLALKSEVALIDCQVENPHLRSLGARCISRAEFESALVLLVPRTIPTDQWALALSTQDLS